MAVRKANEWARATPFQICHWPDCEFPERAWPQWPDPRTGRHQALFSAAFLRTDPGLSCTGAVGVCVRSHAWKSCPMRVSALGGGWRAWDKVTVSVNCRATHAGLSPNTVAHQTKTKRADIIAELFL